MMRRVIALTLILLLVSFALAVDDEAARHAASASVPEGLTAREVEVYRDGFAAGYFEALHPAGNYYILNKSSHKFHLPSCSSAASMKAKNREEFHGTREQVIAKGYEPCGNCNP